MGATVGDSVVTLSSIVGAVCGDATDLFVHWYLAEQVGQHRGIADVAPGDLDGADLQRFLVDAEVDLAPDAPFGAAVLAGVPLTFTLDLDASAVRSPLGYCAAIPERGSADAAAPRSRCRGC